MKKHCLSSRTDNIAPFIVMEVLEKAQEMIANGEDIVRLEIGEPDFPTPDPIKEAAIRAFSFNDTHYTHSLGKLELREAIAGYYMEKYGVKISPEQVIVTSGTSPGMLLIFSVLLNRGDEIILPDPYYACYPNFINYLEAQPVYVPVYEEDGFKYKPEEIKKYITPKTKAILVNSPGNPTGTVFSAADYKEIANMDITVVSDEIYNGLIYEGEEHSILEFTDNAFVMNGFSKLFAMTGWRLGYVIAPLEFVRSMQKLQQNLFICASSFVQEGGIVAIKDCHKEVHNMVKIYDQRRQYILKRLKELGIATKLDPTGAFYTLANVKKYTNNSYAFAFEILQKAKVAVTPGIDFGPNCEGYIRLSYANSLKNIREGMDRLQNYLDQLKD
jgi:aspartate/methionine/tyrosine aminotransferase